MNPDFPSRPENRLDRFESWVRARKWRQWLLLYPLVMILTVIIMIAWIAMAFALGSTDRNAGAVALNYVLIGFIATVGLLIMHPAMYRWFWHLERKRRAGALPANRPALAYGSEPTAPPPRIDWPWRYRLRHWLARLLGVVALLFFFMPYRNQIAIAHFLILHSGGQASAGSLAALLFFYVPFCLIMGLIVLLTHRQMRRRDAGLLSAQESLLLDAELTWLFSFGATLIMAVILCYMAGSMIVTFLA